MKLYVVKEFNGDANMDVEIAYLETKEEAEEYIRLFGDEHNEIDVIDTEVYAKAVRMKKQGYVIYRCRYRAQDKAFFATPDTDRDKEYIEFPDSREYPLTMYVWSKSAAEALVKIKETWQHIKKTLKDEYPILLSDDYRG